MKGEIKQVEVGRCVPQRHLSRISLFRPVLPFRGAKFSSLRAFSLLELLAAIAILISIILMLAIVFAESDKTWELGTSRADVNGAGRAALDLIARDIEFSLADDILSFSATVGKGSHKSVSYGVTNNQICAVSLQNDNYNGQRAVREVYYYVKEMENESGVGLGRFELMRGYYSDKISDTVNDNTPANNTLDYLDHCYFATNGPWYEIERPSGGVVAENVVGFRVYVTGQYFSGTNTIDVSAVDPSSLPGSAWNSDQPDYSNSLPEYIDVVLDMLDEKRAIQVANTTGTDQRDLLERHLKRFTSRIYFQNRDGYKLR